MRKLLCIGFVVISSLEAYKFTGHTFFSNTVPFISATPERVSLFRLDWADQRDCGIRNGFEIVPFGGSSLGDELAHYFLPAGHGSTLGVLEYKTSVPSSTLDPAEGRDLEARNFNIETDSATETFRSVISLKPKHSYFGLGLCTIQCFKKFWFEFSTALMYVKNTICFSEDILSTGGTATGTPGLNGQPHVGSMTEALKQDGWNYLRIDPSVERKKWGLADIELKFGWRSYECEYAHFWSFAGAILPTGNKPDPRYLFPAVVGNGQHVGVMLGGTMGCRIWHHNDHLVWFEFDNCGRYYFSNEQTRTFDVNDKQWSRYIETYTTKAEAEEAATNVNSDSGNFGANVLTAKVNVIPRFSSSFNFGFVYTHVHFIGEVGYNFFARQGEKLILKSLCDEPAFKSIDGNGDTTIARTISNNFPCAVRSPANYQAITTKSIDLSSGSHPPLINQTFYLVLGYQWPDIRIPTAVSLGGSYQFSRSNSGMDRWMMWLKLNLAF